MLSEKLLAFLEEILKLELKWMYHYPIDDSMFGIETDRYTWTKGVIEGSKSIENLLIYFKKHYAFDEEYFIKTIEELI